MDPLVYGRGDLEQGCKLYQGREGVLLFSHRAGYYSEGESGLMIVHAHLNSVGLC